MLEHVWRHIENSVTFNNKHVYDSRLKFDPANEERLLTRPLFGQRKTKTKKEKGVKAEEEKLRIG